MELQVNVGSFRKDSFLSAQGIENCILINVHSSGILLEWQHFEYIFYSTSSIRSWELHSCEWHYCPNTEDWGSLSAPSATCEHKNVNFKAGNKH
jgi:hypothetical protein